MEITKEDDERTIEIATRINEKIVLHIICGLLKEYNQSFFEEGLDIGKSYCKELEYSFRFRDLSKESMYLMFDPFYYLKLIENSVTNDGKIIL